jgi:hypothetical protein
VVTRIAGSISLDLQGTIVSFDGVYDFRRNRKVTFNRGMVPNINPNPRGRKTPQRGRKPFFDAAIFQERFNTSERVFGWEDRFRGLLPRFAAHQPVATRLPIIGVLDDRPPPLPLTLNPAKRGPGPRWRRDDSARLQNDEMRVSIYHRYKIIASRW